MERRIIGASNWQMFYNIVFLCLYRIEIHEIHPAKHQTQKCRQLLCSKVLNCGQCVPIKAFGIVHGYLNYLFPVKLWTPSYFNLWGKSQRSLAVLAVWISAVSEKKVTDTLVYFNCGKLVRSFKKNAPGHIPIHLRALCLPKPQTGMRIYDAFKMHTLF